MKKMKKLKLKKVWKISIFVLLLVFEVILYTLIGKGLSLSELVLYCLGIINTALIVALGIEISDEMGYR